MQVKICGLSTADTVEAAVKAGADYLGFIFFDASPRNVTPRRVFEIAAKVPPTVKRVAVVVDAADDALTTILSHAPIDLLQLHGGEPPERVREIRTKYGIPVMKAVPLAEEADISAAKMYEEAADMLLFDAKPPKSLPDALPGGNALAFDWQLLAGRHWTRPWFLSGGLDPVNVADAIEISGASAVDVSSGVEDEPGVKNRALIAEFISAAKGV